MALAPVTTTPGPVVPSILLEASRTRPSPANAFAITADPDVFSIVLSVMLTLGLPVGTPSLSWPSTTNPSAVRFESAMFEKL